MPPTQTVCPAEGKGVVAMNRDIVTNAVLIPTDPRTGKPLVTSAMKAACIGEFSVEITIDCPGCHEEDTSNGCETCKGTGLVIQDFDIPWDTMKDIYKMMAGVAAAGIVSPPMQFTVGVDEGREGGDRTAVAIRHGDQVGVFTAALTNVKAEFPVARYCPVCPFSTSLLELQQEDGYQRLKCPHCNYARSLR